MRTARYASPEQLRGETVTAQADVYSLGILAYEVLAGEGPYRGASAREAFTAHLTGEPRPIGSLRPGVSAELERLLLRCLSREPAHRPRAEDLVRRLTEEPDPEKYEGLGILRRRIPQIVSSTFAGGIVLLGLVIGLVDIGRLPPVAFELTVSTVAWGLLASAVLAWHHGERGRQVVPATEVWLLAGLAAGWIASLALLLRDWTRARRSLRSRRVPRFLAPWPSPTSFDASSPRS